MFILEIVKITLNKKNIFPFLGILHSVNTEFSVNIHKYYIGDYVAHQKHPKKIFFSLRTIKPQLRKQT